MVTEDALDAAADAARGGGLVVYPTETVYGLGADALDPDAVGAVFDAKRRDREKPLSFAFPDADAASEHVYWTDTERAFAEEFLPGPVTLVCEKRDSVPDALTGGRDRVGVRVPDHEVALALLDRVAPLTATSANVSGEPSVTDPADLDAEFRARVDAVLDAGETPGGTGSTVVDVERNEILREGAVGDAVREWLAARA
ncbi:L-threonylcarbamoyladenylate synthase [Halobacterium sp. CBA1126]|uniref:L-threonylcarbamoyladenylate synthase n=1 Tax=Halobacterium sp. CBA1126 TaxID=2668074 RepID=UPI0012F75A52|nr:L-threonylcarbamoyladenylate synthase [Halobacterium sp. CBA1126]MUV60598.1 threonylcarbamoyl-AMP synthase [Halobacterium sp. CBA1126]